MDDVLDPDLRGALDAAPRPMDDAGDARRLRAFAAESCPEFPPAGHDDLAECFAVWLTLARTCGIGSDVTWASAYLLRRIPTTHSVAAARILEEYGALVFGIDPSTDTATVHLACPSVSFLNLLHP